MISEYIQRLVDAKNFNALITIQQTTSNREEKLWASYGIAEYTCIKGEENALQSYNNLLLEKDLPIDLQRKIAQRIHQLLGMPQSPLNTASWINNNNNVNVVFSSQANQSQHNVEQLLFTIHELKQENARLQQRIQILEQSSFIQNNPPQSSVAPTTENQKRTHQKGSRMDDQRHAIMTQLISAKRSISSANISTAYEKYDDLLKKNNNLYPPERQEALLGKAECLRRGEGWRLSSNKKVAIEIYDNLLAEKGLEPAIKQKTFFGKAMCLLDSGQPSDKNTALSLLQSLRQEKNLFISISEMRTVDSVIADLLKNQQTDFNNNNAAFPAETSTGTDLKRKSDAIASETQTVQPVSGSDPKRQKASIHVAPSNVFFTSEDSPQSISSTNIPAINKEADAEPTKIVSRDHR